MVFPSLEINITSSQYLDLLMISSTALSSDFVLPKQETTTLTGSSRARRVHFFFAFLNWSSMECLPSPTFLSSHG